MNPVEQTEGPGHAVAVFFENWVGPQLRNALISNWVATIGVKCSTDLRALAPLDEELVRQLTEMQPAPERAEPLQKAML